MKMKLLIPAVAALALGASAASAQSVSGNVNGTLGKGAAAAGRDGAIAGGLTAGGSAQYDKQDRKAKRRGDDRRGDMQRPQLGNASSTYGAGAVYTDRNRSSAGVTSGASASGQGVQSTGTTVDAYGETTRQGSSADIYGDSVATSGERPRRR